MNPFNHFPVSVYHSRLPERTVRFVNGIPQYLFIVLLLLFFFLRFQANPNEEHYLALARRFMDPDWLPHSFSFDEPASTRILYQYLAGFFLRYFSFEAVAGWGRALLCLLIGYPLLKIYRLLGLTNIDVLLHLPVLYFFQGKAETQSFFALEWIFLSVEPKVLAYYFVLSALFFILKERYYSATLLLAGATYFHVLVGGYLMGYFGLYHLFRERSLRRSVYLGLLYVLLVTPFLLLVSGTISSTLASQAADVPVDLDWIYTHVRQPFHTAIFLSGSYFVHNHLDGVAVTVAFFFICLFVFGRYEQEYNRKLNLFNLLLFAGTFLAIIAAYFDENGAFVKFFPFRVNALFTFLVLLQTVFLLRRFLLKKEVLPYVQFAVLVWFLAVNAPKVGYNFFIVNYRYLTEQLEQPDFLDVSSYLKHNTPEDAVVLFLAQGADPEVLLSLDAKRSLMRTAERDCFVAYHFAPISPGSEKLYEWYRRLQAKRTVVEDYRNICGIRKDFRVDYLLSDFRLEGTDCWELEYENGAFFLYRLQ